MLLLPFSCYCGFCFCFFFLARSWQKGTIAFFARFDFEFHGSMHVAVMRSVGAGMI
jgi:hypothetical protein